MHAWKVEMGTMEAGVVEAGNGGGDHSGTLMGGKAWLEHSTGPWGGESEANSRLVWEVLLV